MLKTMHHGLCRIPFSTRGITYVDFRDITIVSLYSAHVLLVWCRTYLSEQLSEIPYEPCKFFSQAFRGCPKVLSARLLRGECSEQSLLLPNKGELVHTLICLGFGMDGARLFYLLSANNLPLSVWSWYKANRVWYHMLIPVRFLADKSEEYKLCVRLFHINASRQLHGQAGKAVALSIKILSK